MKIQLEGRSGANVIRAYAPGKITVNQDVYAKSLVITPDRLVTDWRPRSVAELTAADFDMIVRLEPEVVLLGTGARLTFPPAELMRSLIVAAIGFEAMDTSAACRTYNVLMSEGRRVAAALLIERS